LEPLPPKKTWRDDDERRILGEVQNTMEYEPSFNMSKEFSFGPMVSSQVSKAKKKAILKENMQSHQMDDGQFKMPM
jgi:hypothetical protein